MKTPYKNPQGAVNLSHRSPLLLGTSIYNGRFNTDYVKDLLSWAYQQTDHTLYVMIPDKPMRWTLQAGRGYSEQKAKRRARERANNLANKFTNKAQELHIPPQHLKIIRWKDVEENPIYHNLLQSFSQIIALQGIGDALYTGLHDQVLSVLRSHGNTHPSPEDIQMGMRFLLEEFSFILQANKILGIAPHGISYVYHRTMKILDQLLQSQFPDIQPTPGIGLITVKSPT